MSSLLNLAQNQSVSLIRLLTERINGANTPVQKFPWKVHCRVASNVVEAALRAALEAPIPSSLREVASHLGYRSVAPLRFRYPVLSREIARRRRTEAITTRHHLTKQPVPKERIEEALAAELTKQD
jgi:hypothetical protein